MYAAVIEESIWIEGDERSKTNPGHGYPGYTHTSHVFREFGSKDELISWIGRQQPYTKYRIFEVKELSLVTNTSIELKDL